MKIPGLLLAALLPVSAFADNCSDPRDDFDGLYCLNKVYQEADNELNERYKELRSFLNAKEKKQLKKSQLGWIKDRNKQCSFKDQNGFYVNLKCTRDITVSRTNELQDRIRECKAIGCQSAKL